MYCSFQKHAGMLGMYMPNLACMHLGVHASCKPRIVVAMNSMNVFMYILRCDSYCDTRCKPC